MDVRHSSSLMQLRGVRVHNLQGIDLDLPLGKLIAITGVSGSGKSSLAFDTLYAEGQRRYVESFSTYARRFLERFEKPAADRIEPIPPAISVRQRLGAGSRRATVGTATEVYDSLRILFARLGIVECPGCLTRVERHDPASLQRALEQLAPGLRMIVGFPAAALVESSQSIGSEAATAIFARSTAAGFSRWIVNGRIVNHAAELPAEVNLNRALVVVDRLTTAGASERLADSLETAFVRGSGFVVVLVEAPEGGGKADVSRAPRTLETIDGRQFDVRLYSDRFVCSNCRREFAEPEPALFNFNSPLGACSGCHGLGSVSAGAGPTGEREICPACRGTRLKPEALAVRLAGMTIADVAGMTIVELQGFLDQARHSLAADQLRPVNQIVPQALSRVAGLRQLGLGYLSLDRAVRTLSVGEGQRVRLAAALGSNLVNVLYVVDEPTCGLHARDIEPLLAAIVRLRDAGNTLVVVDHNAELIRAADQVVDLGPGAGREGGRVMFQGASTDLEAAQTTTADFLSGRRTLVSDSDGEPRAPSGWLRLEGVEHHNLRGVTVEFPLGVLCVVTGVSGSGKSSLVEETLFPAVANGLSQRGGADEARTPAGLRPPTFQGAPRPAGRFQSLVGLEQIDDVSLVDQTPIGRSGRGNAATILNLFAEIRTLFAGTAEAKVHNFSAAHFSFNKAGGGRCETCHGAGSVSIDLQFLPDVVMTCPDCHGTRYRREVLEARYRGLSIAEVLSLTVAEAFGFFRGRHRLQRKLKLLKDVGLDYLTLGQSADTLSGGESQRLKLAACLARGRRGCTLFLIDEPTTGLHPADIVRLVNTLRQMVAAGHSLIVVEHHLDFVRQADYVIDLGPGAGDAGGRIVAMGTPRDVSRVADSITGRYLARE